MSPAGSRHGLIARALAAVDGFCGVARPGVALGAETGFRIASNPDTVLLTDAAFIRKERVSGGLPKGFSRRSRPCSGGAFAGRSPEQSARQVANWLAAGSAAVWVADPETETVRVYSADGKALIHNLGDALSGGDVLPGFSAAVADIFAMWPSSCANAGLEAGRK